MGLSPRVTTLWWWRCMRVPIILRAKPSSATLLAGSPVVGGSRGRSLTQAWPRKKTSTVEQGEDGGWLTGGAPQRLRRWKKGGTPNCSGVLAAAPGSVSVKDRVVVVHAPVSPTVNDATHGHPSEGTHHLNVPRRGPTRRTIILDFERSPMMMVGYL